jgi:type IV secretory pathway ATPase VirB11/archaellum biosynthesis ATPase
MLEVGGMADGEPDATTVPPPLPPDDPEAWYASGVQDQRTVHPGVVVTVRSGDVDFAYEVRRPPLSAAGEAALETVLDYFADAHLERPRTREGAAERMTEGFSPKHERVVASLVDLSPSAQRRLTYHALAELACFGDLTPYALDDAIEVADVVDDGVVVHTADYAPAATDLPAEADFLPRFASERLDRYTVSFLEFDVEVVVSRENLLGEDPFTTKYAVREPDLLPGDRPLIEECKERLWETPVDGVVEDEVSFVRDRAREFLARRLTARNTRAWAESAGHRLRAALATWNLAVPPVDRRYADDRLSDLLYYVLRDYVGYGILTVPIRDPGLEDVEANRVGERVKVIPRHAAAHNERVPSNLRFDDEGAFVNVVTQLAAEDGTELNASTPSAKVNLDPQGIEETIRCAVALPTVSEDGPHISIRKQSPSVMTPVELVDRGSLSTELVALLWLVYERHGVVLFSGPTGVGKTTLMNAHMPFVPFNDRPISIDEGSREVYLPHETGVSLSTRDHQDAHKRVTMAELMTQGNYLNPDVEVIAEINTPESFATFAETLNTGHGVIGTTHAADVETLVNRVIEQDLAPYLLRELDLVVFPAKVQGERYVSRVVEFLTESEYDDLGETGRHGTVEKEGTTVRYNVVAERTREGTLDLAYAHPDLGDPAERAGLRTFERLAERADQPLEAVTAEYRRKHNYVEYLVQEGITDMDALFDLLADLRTNEAATVERLHSERQQRGGPDR